MAHLFGLELRANRCEISVDAPENLTLDSYLGPLQQALAALVDNALVHGVKGTASPALKLAARELEAGSIEFVVSDNGPGIAPELIDKVFEPFFTTRLAEGNSGLGLHLAHNVVRGVLGGTIQIQSEPGSGTRVTLRLPAHAPGKA
ncbi:ATP-binding protein [Niveibacterium sp. 24ML]|uniref:sensor histidine kinase n=1 Tax=Niveibacterium sp. 24ML TaxID=2985512 RepID=UPI00226D6D36|nr:ATP-binding protein [Niveibacterium sp. 24ML]MCX9156308.1 ATP-binding protein [Niveibacterium sp. 24ML]